MQLHKELLELRKRENQITSEILDKLQLMESGRAYLSLGYSSLFDYLVRGLSYSESTAYQRQSCLRLSKDIPEIKQKIDEGKLSYSTVTMAYKSLKNKSLKEKKQLIQKIENKPAREVKSLLAEPAKPIKIKKTEYQDKVVLRLELSHKQHDKLERLRALRSHKFDVESLLEDLIDRELARFENTDFKKAKSKNPRYISKRLRNAVLKKANYKCQSPGCCETHFLQIDHIKPVRHGGLAKPENLQVLCGAHNRIKG